MREPNPDDKLAIYAEHVARYCCVRCGGLIKRTPFELVKGLVHNVPFCLCGKGGSMIERQMNYSREHRGPAWGPKRAKPLYSKNRLAYHDLNLFAKAVARWCCTRCGGLVPGAPGGGILGGADKFLGRVPLCLCDGRDNDVRQKLNFRRVHGVPWGVAHVKPPYPPNRLKGLL